MKQKQRMYKSRSNIVSYLNVFKQQLSSDVYNALTTIINNTKENML